MEDATAVRRAGSAAYRFMKPPDRVNVRAWIQESRAHRVHAEVRGAELLPVLDLLAPFVRPALADRRAAFNKGRSSE
jgi:hypothetical protein